MKNRLFLNPLNDLAAEPLAARDVLSTPTIVTKIDEGPHYQGFYNQLKQEFVSARYIYYEGIFNNEVHFSDMDTSLVDTLDYPCYSLACEKTKIAFRLAYSLFDKIAYFLNHYLHLSIPEKSVYFRSLWYVSSNEKGSIRDGLINRKNLPLFGLFWLSKDLFDEAFKETMEPEGEQLNELRNSLEHKYLKLHQDWWAPDSGDWLSKDALAYSLTRNDLAKRTLRLLKTARAALIYLSLTIHREEAQRYTNEDRAKMGQILVTPYEDDWKT